MPSGRLLALTVTTFVVPLVAFANGHRVRVDAPRRVEVMVPAGSFTMGVDEAAIAAAKQQCELAYYGNSSKPSFQTVNGGMSDFCAEYESELHHMAPRRVTLDAFLIDRDEVTVTDYRRCIAAGACDLDALIAGDERYIQSAWPIVNVTWDESRRYCEWRGARLPTEAEWERAARGDGSPNVDEEQGNAWPWGDVERPNDFNHGKPRAVTMRELERQPSTIPIKFFGDPDETDGAALLAPPGSYPWGESTYGTRDQAGNVAEWTADAYFREDGKMGYDGLPELNPLRETTSTLQSRIIRGGSWRQPAFIARSNLRDPFNLLYDATKRYSHVGFRCARSIR